MNKYLVTLSDKGVICIQAESVAQAAFRAVDYVDAPREIIAVELWRSPASDSTEPINHPAKMV